MHWLSSLKHFDRHWIFWISLLFILLCEKNIMPLYPLQLVGLMHLMNVGHIYSNRKLRKYWWSQIVMRWFMCEFVDFGMGNFGLQTWASSVLLWKCQRSSMDPRKIWKYEKESTEQIRKQIYPVKYTRLPNLQQSETDIRLTNHFGLFSTVWMSDY